MKKEELIVKLREHFPNFKVWSSLVPEATLSDGTQYKCNLHYRIREEDGWLLVLWGELVRRLDSTGHEQIFLYKIEKRNSVKNFRTVIKYHDIYLGTAF